MIRRIILVAGCCLALAMVAEARDSKPARTAPGDFFLPTTIGWYHGPNVAFGLGARLKSGWTVAGQATVGRLDGFTGSEPFRVGCRNYQVPYDTGSKTQIGVTFTFAAPIKRK
jgi:hypothetical protein